MAQSAAVHLDNEAPTKRSMRPIDLVHLAKQCLGDEQLEHEILRMFDASLESYFKRLGETSDTEAVVHLLHSIRGSASGIGAFAVAAIAYAAETDLREGRPLNGELVADLAHAIEEVRTFIARVLDAEPA